MHGDFHTFLEEVDGPYPYLFAALALLGGQPAPIWVPHASGVPANADVVTSSDEDPRPYDAEVNNTL
jgi:hypothetical protein